MIKNSRNSLGIKESSDNKIKIFITIVGILILIWLFTRDSLAETEFIYDETVSLIAVAVFYKFYRKLNQDFVSYFFFMLMLIMHNLGIYATAPFGIRFDHYMHFVGGFTLAIIGDRLFNEKLGKPKRFLLMLIFALGIGAIGEVAEWIGYGILGEGDGFFFYGIGDEGEWRNAMLDLIFNFFGATMMAISNLFRRIKQ